MEGHQDLKGIIRDGQLHATAKEQRWVSEGCTFDQHTGLWYGPNGCPALSEVTQETMLRLTYEMTHWGTDKMKAWGKQYFSKPFPTVATEICQRCQICPKYNAEKPTHTSQGHFPLPPGSFAVWQLDSIQLPHSQGYRYFLVMVCVYSHWLEAFPYKRATALAVDKILLERTIPTWGIPLELHSDKGAHFTGKILNAVCDLACITFPLCLSSSTFWSSGKTNGIIKTQLAKLSKAFSHRWLKLLPIVLLN